MGSWRKVVEQLLHRLHAAGAVGLSCGGQGYTC